MNPSISVTIPNIDQVVSAFKKAPQLMKSVLPNAINQSLLAIGAQAARNAPVRTGNLRSSILDPERGLTLASNNVFQGSVGSGVGYGLFVEMGTRYMRAQPFLQPAVNSESDQVNKFFTAAVQSVLNSIRQDTL